MNSVPAFSNHTLLKSLIKKSGLDAIYQKVMDNERLSLGDGITLFETRDLSSVGYMANIVRERLHDKRSYFVRNRQLNPTNVCEYSCMFCSFYRREGEEGGYTMTMDEIARRVREGVQYGIQEIHITSGLHPRLPFSYYTDMLKTIKEIAPHIHIKAFTAVEIEYYAEHYGMSIRDVLEKLIGAGLEAMPGGGAEIFAERVRKKICDEKSTAGGWFKVHETAHALGLVTNATMLYGHIERYDERADHLVRLRTLQDESKAKGSKGHFNTFIPLKYQHENNRLEKLPPVSAFEDLKVVSVSRLMLDNFKNIKAYWVVIGKRLAQMALSYGANEIEGTILEERIMSMAGTDSAHGMTEPELIKLIADAGRQPIERDALYNVIKTYDQKDIDHSQEKPTALPVLN
jgi:aminodeoxyfutalosine synthase